MPLSHETFHDTSGDNEVYVREGGHAWKGVLDTARSQPKLTRLASSGIVDLMLSSALLKDEFNHKSHQGDESSCGSGRHGRGGLVSHVQVGDKAATVALVKDGKLNSSNAWSSNLHGFPSGSSQKNP